MEELGRIGQYRMDSFLNLWGVCQTVIRRRPTWKTHCIQRGSYVLLIFYGRESTPVSQPLIYIYENGSVEQKVVLK